MTVQAPSQTVHATAVALEGRAVLIRGAPGSGKSTLALELLEATGTGLGGRPLAAQLVADDQALLTVKGNTVYAAPPEKLAGLLEVRGLGLVPVRNPCPEAPVALVVDLLPQAERMPEPGETAEILGVILPKLVFPAHACALAARLRTGFLLRTAQLPGGAAQRKEPSP